VRPVLLVGQLGQLWRQMWHRRLIPRAPLAVSMLFCLFPERGSVNSIVASGCGVGKNLRI
jgi:hypothetical protein